ncbi:alpha/beta fold hydrolase [Lactococcus lactis]|uniref:Alpha/beta superfamily hydrolase n=1 Tax=Lactococcus lactis subsp. lactis TaxID=1360 RepID=A0A1V0NF01_LACLL|nr:alpha/beta hydrolase [Lactococcus lactis]ARD98502.1 alpha/beta superfamily hydrolase [Lactococcus lactis subsp. lactis]NLS47343.1 alpha/beta fold hydrolase [Lactococcus lactis]
MAKNLNMSDECWYINSDSMKYKLDGFRYHKSPQNGTRLLIQGLGCESKIIWNGVTNEFSKSDSHRDIIAFDVRGVGKSTGNPISLEQIVDDTIQIVCSEEGPIQLVGHSLGGIIALKVAEQVQEYIDSVVLICSNPQYTPKAKNGFAWRANQIQEMQTVSCIFQKVIPRSFSENFINNHPIAVSEFMDMLNRQSPTNYSKLSLIASEADALGAFDKIDVPLLMIVGSEDPSITIKRSTEFASRRDCNLEIVYGAGHNIPLEDPGMLTHIIQQFDSSIH